MNRHRNRLVQLLTERNRMLSFTVPYRDFESDTQNIDELHAIVDHQGFGNTLSCLAAVAKLFYGEGALSQALQGLAESDMVTQTSKRQLRRAMRDAEICCHRPLHSRVTKPQRTAVRRK
jgi:hypothetical protein